MRISLVPSDWTTLDGRSGSYDGSMARSVEELEHDEIIDAVVSVTDDARKVVIEAMESEPDTENLALWLEVRGVQGANFAYDLYFQARRDAAEGVAYLRLSGGCQGCAMSRMTLTQGIEVTLREEVPQVTRIADVTDHTGGENPYY